MINKIEAKAKAKLEKLLKVDVKLSISVRLGKKEEIHERIETKGPSTKKGEQKVQES